MMETSEKTPLLPPDSCQETAVYGRRWWILTVFSLLAMFQCCVWNTWGPVVDVVSIVYPAWTQGTVSLLANWGAIMFLTFTFPILYLQNRNLRSAMVLTSSLIALGKIQSHNFFPIILVSRYSGEVSLPDL